MGRYNETDIHPVALALTLAMAIVILAVRRDRAAIPLLLVACLVTHTQRIVVGGLDFSMLRIIIIFGWARVIYRGETGDYRHHPLDTALIAWLGIGTIVYVLGPRGGVDAFIHRLGSMLDAAGTYFLFRILLRDVRDVQRTVQVFSWLVLLMLGPMIFEFLTGRNLFAALGGVPEFTHIRRGRLRCQASFSHPIMAGTFGATTLALLGALWASFPRRRLHYAAAIVAGFGVTVLSASSGPLVASLAAVGGWVLWPFRGSMRMLQWATVTGILVIHFAREKPFWHLIGRVSDITGGTGYHRVTLIDAFVARAGEWWLLGAGMTSHWKGAQGSDITNQYLLEGIRGGLGTLIAFLVLFYIAFRTTGRTVRHAEKLDSWTPLQRRRTIFLAWGLGVCLAVHCVAFIGVSYFGQLISVLYLHLAMVPSLAVALSRGANGAASRRSGRGLKRPEPDAEPELGPDEDDGPRPTLASPKLAR